MSLTRWTIGSTRSSEAARRAALATVCAVLFLTFLDNTIVAVALADIQTTLKVGVSALQWIVDGYALTFAALMLTGGTLGDILGRKKIMLAGVAVFCAGSVIAALAPSGTVLIAGRVVMGVGAAASEPGTLSVIRHLYTDRADRAKALGGWAAVSGLALALGPVIGGVIVGFSDWRGIFWFNLGFGLLALLAAAATVPETSDPQGRRFDPLGLALGAGAIVAGTYGVIAGETLGYTTWWVIVLFVVSGAAICGFVFVERRVPSPVLRPSLFRHRSFTGANVVAFTTFFGVFAIFFFVALYLQVIASNSAYQTALDFLPMAVGMVLASVFTGRWVAAAGPRMPMAVGCTLGGVGIILTDAFLGPHTGFATLGWTLAIAGVGFGIAIVPATSAALSAVPAERSGMAASVTNTSRELGAVLGVAALGAIIDSQLTAHLTARLHQLGIPANFQALVINAVTHGGIPQGAASQAAKSFGKIVTEVIHAAYQAFYAGLNIALLLSGAMLLAAAALTAFMVHGRSSPALAGEAAAGGLVAPAPEADGDGAHAADGADGAGLHPGDESRAGDQPQGGGREAGPPHPGQVNS